MKTIRRATVVMMSSAQRLEIVEVKTPVRQEGSIETPLFLLDEKEAEQQARRVLREAGRDDSEFHYVGTLVAVTHGPTSGRLNWAKQPEMTIRQVW